MKITVDPTQPGHRARLLEEGLRHFYATGFHGTSVDDILAAAEAPKGSFYHHFGSKDAFAQAVVQRYSEWQLDSLAKFAARTDLSAYQKIAAYFAAMQARFERSDHKVACLVGKFSTELAPVSDEFSSTLSSAMKKWRVALTKLITEGHRDGSIRRDMSAKQQAFVIMSLIQGSLVVALADRNHESVAAVRAALPKVLAAIP
jgi:TetR/AcrR family transcriptional repressor of nem operon